MLAGGDGRVTLDRSMQKHRRRHGYGYRKTIESAPRRRDDLLRARRPTAAAACNRDRERRTMDDPLRFHRQAHQKHGTDSKNLYGDSFMERLAEKTASGLGTVQFVVRGFS
jgi:hypothetical protein